MARVKFTDMWVRNLTPPKIGRLEYSDAITPCLYLRLSAAGSKVFSVLMRRGRLQRKTLGSYPLLSLSQARRDAMHLQRLAAEDARLPDAPVAETVPTLAEVIADYVELSLKGRIESWEGVQRTLNKPVLVELRAKPNTVHLEIRMAAMTSTFVVDGPSLDRSG